MKHNPNELKNTTKTMLAAVMMRHHRNIGHDDVQYIFQELERLNGGDAEWDYKGTKQS